MRILLCVYSKVITLNIDLFIDFPCRLCKNDIIDELDTFIDTYDFEDYVCDYIKNNSIWQVKSCYFNKDEKGIYQQVIICEK